MKTKILLTGATGFIGSALLQALSEYDVVVVGRTPTGNDANVRFFPADLTAPTDYSSVLQGIEVIIHTAARAHVMQDAEHDPLAEYRRVNVDATVNLARQAAQAGVKRFIFLSSIKVNGESTDGRAPFSVTDTVKPEDAYGISKAEAEQQLLAIASSSAMEVVIIRPPLVYGPGVKANFAAMLKLAKKNLPLPLGAVHNKRSLVALDNLVDLVIVCISHPKAANQIFLVSDDADISTTRLLQLMTKAANKAPRLIPVPTSWLYFAAKLVRKQAIVTRLCGNLQLDICHTKQTLDWQPPLSVEEGIARCFAGKR